MPSQITLEASPSMLPHNLQLCGRWIAYASKDQVHIVDVDAPATAQRQTSFKVVCDSPVICVSSYTDHDGRGTILASSPLKILLVDTELKNPFAEWRLSVEEKSDHITTSHLLETTLLCLGTASGNILLLKSPQSPKRTSPNLGESTKIELQGCTVSRVFSLQHNSVTSLSSSIRHGNRCVLSSHCDGSVLVWNLDSGQEVPELVLKPDGIPGVTAFCMKSIFIVAKLNGEVHLLDEENKTCGRIQAAAGPIQAFDFHPDLMQMATVSSDGLLCVWAITDHKADGFSFKDVNLLLNERFEDIALTGVQFMETSTRRLAVAGYDTNKLTIYSAL